MLKRPLRSHIYKKYFSRNSKDFLEVLSQQLIKGGEGHQSHIQNIKERSLKQYWYYGEVKPLQLPPDDEPKYKQEVCRKN